MPRRKTIAKKAQKNTKREEPTTFNRKAQWEAYRELQMQADEAWGKFRDDVKKNARSDILIRDHNHLLLLLGECNYMARECMRIESQGKRKSR